MHFPVCSPGQAGLCRPHTQGPPGHRALSHKQPGPGRGQERGRSGPSPPVITPGPARGPHRAPRAAATARRSPPTTAAATSVNQRPGRTAGPGQCLPQVTGAAALPPSPQCRGPGRRSGRCCPGNVPLTCGRRPPGQGPARPLTRACRGCRGCRGSPAAVSAPRGPGRARLWPGGVQGPGRAPQAAGGWRRCPGPLRCRALPPGPTSVAQFGHPHECPRGLCCFRTRSSELLERRVDHEVSAVSVPLWRRAALPGPGRPQRSVGPQCRRPGRAAGSVSPS